MNYYALLKAAILVGLLVFGVNAVSADPSQLYVSPVGNDSWDGQFPVWQNTTFGPKLTIKNATGTVTADGTVYVASGTYNENGISFNRNVNIIGENKDTTIINGTNNGTIMSIGFNRYVSLTNLTFTNGNSTTGGGAIAISSGHAIIDNCIFQNNIAGLTGGAIHSQGTGGTPASLVITNSVFTNNKANGAGWGGAILIALSSLTVTGSDFIDNIGTAGSAIHSNYGSILGINFNRIIGTGNSLIYSDVGGDATLNWWGSNADPSTRVSGPSPVTVDPWLNLTATATPPAIGNNSNSLITADLQHDNYGNYYDPSSWAHVPDGLLVTFTPGLYGTVNPLTNTTLNGAATTIFTANNLGLSNLTATLDSQTVNTLVNVIVGPVLNTRTGLRYFTIQAAIDDVLTLDGDTLNVDDPGSPYIENVQVYKQLNIMSIALVTVQAADPFLPVFYITSSGNTIDGFTITGSSFAYGVRIDTSSYNNITNNDINSNYAGISMFDTTNNLISNNIISLCVSGIEIYSSNNTNVSGNTIDGADYGISLYDGSGNTIDNNLISMTNLDPLTLYGTVDPLIGTTVSNNIIIGGNNGLYLVNGLTSTIINNNISNCVQAGINVEISTDTAINGNIVDGLLAVDNTLWGINLLSCTGINAITGNTVTNCTEGVNLYDTTGTTISSNTITDSVFDGVAMQLSSGNIISGNTGITGNVAGIRLINGSENNIITNNNFSGNIWTSISLDGSNFNTITNNIVNNNQEGMYLYASNNNQVNHITANNNIWDGIAIHDSSDNIITQNTNVSGNNCGIRIIGTSTNNQVTNNLVDANLWSAISLDTAGGNTISNNNLTNTHVGVFLYSSSGNTINQNNILNDDWDGIYMGNGSNNNQVTLNSVNGSYYGARIQSSTGNTLYTNNFYTNTVQGYSDSANTWDNGVDTGNYWNTATPPVPYLIDGPGANQDNYPSTIPF